VGMQETVLWAVAATSAMTLIFEISRGLGWSRLNLPLVFGMYFTAHRSWANVYGVGLYLALGWLFALGYVWALRVLMLQGWLGGLLIGLAHGLFLLIVVLPLLPYIHPRIATDYDGPTSRRRLEPPGFLGLNYGLGTPLTALCAHVAYGLVIGLGYYAY
jgi:hypothetical protein